MLLQKIDAQRIKDGIDLRDLVGQTVALVRESSKESHGPCPFCGGVDRFIVTKEYCSCRPGHCGFKGDAIEYTMRLHGLSFKEACERLSNGTLPTTSELVRPAKVERKANEFDAEYWTGQAKAGALNPQNSTDTTAVLGREYLKGRGLTDETIEAYKLGVRLTSLPGTENKEKRPAVTLPWYDRNGKLAAVKMRFLATHEYTDSADRQRKESKTSRGNFAGNMFGWQAVKGPEQRRVLIITEGEMNCPSFWQVAGQVADVLSCGTESMLNTLPDWLLEYAARYEYRLVWADKGQMSEDAAKRLNAASMRSPNGMDANDLLQQGKLQPLVEKMLRRMGAFDDKPTLAPPPAPAPAPVTELEEEELFDVPPSLYGPNDPRQPLPDELCVEGIQTFAEAWARKMVLDTAYRVALGGQPGAFYLAAPIEFIGKRAKGEQVASGGEG